MVALVPAARHAHMIVVAFDLANLTRLRVTTKPGQATIISGVGRRRPRAMPDPREHAAALATILGEPAPGITVTRNYGDTLLNS